jgi:hypothetical protein
MKRMDIIFALLHQQDGNTSMKARFKKVIPCREFAA